MKGYVVTVPREYTSDQKASVIDHMINKFPKGTRFRVPGETVYKYVCDPNCRHTVTITCTYTVNGREQFGFLTFRVLSSINQCQIEEYPK